jgi:NAD+ synthase
MTDILNDEILNFDRDATINRICDGLRKFVIKSKKRGFVVAMSGGIDSSVSATLAVKALGANKVYGLLLPEQDSSSASEDLGQTLANFLGIKHSVKNIASTLNAIGCYSQRDEAIKRVFPDYTEDWKNKIVISGGSAGLVNHFRLVVQKPSGEMADKKLSINEYLQIVAATNYKQRIRKTVEYFHADRLNYAVIGTPNRVEYDQGFFVRNGDGSADVKPIAHLYKTQVYALAKHMGLPEKICNTTPTTDTYSLSQGQDEFYYGLPYKEMDVALWALNNNKSAEQLAGYLNISVEQASLVFKDIATKRLTTAPLHWKPVLLESVQGPIVDSDV